MSEEKLAGILARQVSDGEKRRRADFVIDTSGGLEETFEEVRAVVDRLIGELARKEDRHA
jgi:dephospho-CoA kinase